VDEQRPGYAANDLVRAGLATANVGREEIIKVLARDRHQEGARA
jgi:hypothetical protein